MNRREFISSVTAGGFCTLFDSQAFAAAVAGPQPRTLILGGTAFALGVALAQPSRAVVLERGIHLAPEFSMTGDWAEPGVPKTPLGRELLAALEKDGMITAGRLELPPLSDFLQGFFTDHGGTAFFNAELVSLAKTGSAYSVCVYGGSAAGLGDFTCGGFLDTTDVGWKNRGQGDVAAKRFSAIASKGLFSVELDAAAGWHDARLALHAAFATHGGGAKILAENASMKCLYKSGNGTIRRVFPDEVTWVPSAQFPTFIQAFEEGLSWTLA